MILILLSFHNHGSVTSITRVLHATTWNYFTLHLPDRFIRSPRVVKEAIMSDINDLVTEFRRISSDVGASLFAMFRLFEILQKCFIVCFDIVSVCDCRLG